MNCKQGDLAIVVKSYEGHEGKIVQCINFLGYRKWLNDDGSVDVCATWRIDRVLVNPDGYELTSMTDEQLRPIRPSKGDDETLSWAGRPEKVAA